MTTREPPNLNNLLLHSTRSIEFNIFKNLLIQLLCSLIALIFVLFKNILDNNTDLNNINKYLGHNKLSRYKINYN